jgi:hypothetical protein
VDPIRSRSEVSERGGSIGRLKVAWVSLGEPFISIRLRASRWDQKTAENAGVPMPRATQVPRPPRLTRLSRFPRRPAPNSALILWATAVFLRRSMTVPRSRFACTYTARTDRRSHPPGRIEKEDLEWRCDYGNGD